MILAILQGEPERAFFLSRIKAAVEASIVVLARRNHAGLSLYRDLIADLAIETVPLQIEHVAEAVDAFDRYGKGRHRAALNLGDCFSYALAKVTDQPLLFKRRRLQVHGHQTRDMTGFVEIAGLDIRRSNVVRRN